MNITSMIEYHEQKSAGGDGGGDSGGRASMPREFGVIETDAETAASSRSTRRTPTRPPCPATRTASTPRWATTFSPRARCCACCTRTPPTRAASTISARTFCRSWRARRHLRLRFPDQPDPRRARRRAALLARRGNHRRLLRSQHGPALRQPALNLYNREWPLRTAQLSRPAGQVHFRR